MQNEKREEIMRRLRCIEGHTQGVVRMLEAEAECVALMRQIQAIQGALVKVAQLILCEYLKTQFSDSRMQKDHSFQDKLMMEFVDLLKFS